MKITSFFLFIAITATSVGYSEENQNFSPNTEATNNHRVYAGPDLFGVYFHAEGPFDEVSNKGFFGGVKLGYDYTKPSAFYFGADALLSLGNTTSSETSPDYPDGFSERLRISLCNLEARYGYTFGSPFSKSSLSPFIGLGGYRSRLSRFKHTQNWIYNAVGLRVNQQFLKNFDVGFNLKASYAIDSNFSHFASQTKRWGYEVAVPFTWRVGSTKKWDVQFQPYVSKIPLLKGNFIGSRFIAGYSF
jgi:hypothetical protein